VDGGATGVPDPELGWTAICSPTSRILPDLLWNPGGAGPHSSPTVPPLARGRSGFTGGGFDEVIWIRRGQGYDPLVPPGRPALGAGIRVKGRARDLRLPARTMIPTSRSGRGRWEQFLRNRAVLALRRRPRTPASPARWRARGFEWLERRGGGRAPPRSEPVLALARPVSAPHGPLGTCPESRPWTATRPWSPYEVRGRRGKGDPGSMTRPKVRTRALALEEVARIDRRTGGRGWGT